jgi:DNA-binding LytR/AlgR family response regulator
MFKISTLVIDDDLATCIALTRILQNFEEVSDAEYIINPHEALPKVLEEYPDIIFLDVNMSQMNGFDFLDLLKEYNYRPYVVFITGKEEYAYQAIKHGAADFLKKPVLKEDLKTAISKYLAVRNDMVYQKSNGLSNTLNAGRIRFETSDGMIFAFIDDIVYLQADREDTYVYSLQDEIILKQSLAEVERLLMEEQFLRISNQHIINTKYLHAYSRKKNQISMKYKDLVIELPVPAKNMKLISILLETV